MIKYFKIIAIALVTIIDTLKVLIILSFSGESKFHKSAKKWAHRILSIVGVNLEVIGSERISHNDSYIFLANHSSLLDIPVLQYGLDNDFRIIYKKELEKIPVFGYGLKKSPYIAVVREDPREAMSSIENAIKTIQKGASVLIFPEGTRSSDGKLQEFKRGAFLLAARSNKPIVPVAIVGTSKLLPSKKFDIRRGDVRLIIGEPIVFNIQTRNDEKELITKVYSIIKEMIDYYEGDWR